MVWWYNLLSNETIADILMFSFFFFFFFLFFLVGSEFLCFNFLVEKDKNKVLKSYMMYFPYFEIKTDLF